MADDDFNSLVDDITIISNNCKTTADTISETFDLINDNTHIVKLANKDLEDLVFRRQDGSYGILVDLINNFRDPEGNQLGYVDTDAGTVPIPRFWPTNGVVIKKYGLPHRKGCRTLLVDAYILNSYWNNKINNVIDRLPIYETSGFD